MREKITNNQLNKILQKKPKQEAIKQSERYKKEYEQSRKQLDEIMANLESLKSQLLEPENQEQ